MGKAPKTTLTLLCKTNDDDTQARAGSERERFMIAVDAVGHDVREGQPTIAGEIDRYLLTGESDPHHTAWPGSFLERANSAHNDLRGALVRVGRRLTPE